MELDFKDPADSDDEFSFGKSRKSKSFNILSSDDESDQESPSPEYPEKSNSTENVSPLKSPESADVGNITLRIPSSPDESSDDEKSETTKPGLQTPSPSATPTPHIFDPSIYDAEGSSDEEYQRNKEAEEYDNNTYDIAPLSEDEVKENQDISNSQKKTKKPKEKIKKERKKSERAAAVEGREAIQREAQRLVRETSISLPYHRPKQRTLNDFLSRHPLPLGRLKKVPLAAIWKDLEEREKEAEKLYKSESSEDEAVAEAPQTSCENPMKLSVENPDEVMTKEDAKPTVEDNVQLSDTVKDESKGLAAASHQEPPLIQLNFDSEEFVNPCENDSPIKSFAKKLSSDSVNVSDSNSAAISSKPQEDCVPHPNHLESSENVMPIDSSEPMLLQVNTEDIMETCDMLPPSDSACADIDSKKDNSVESQESLTKSLMDHLKNKKTPKSKELISELVESPKDPLEQTLIHAQLSLTPKLSADKDNIVELDVDSRNKPGKLGLIHRFIKHVKLKPKETSEVKLSVLNAQTGKDGEVISLTEDALVVQGAKSESGPSCITALKRSLHQSVITARTAIISKKLEQQRFYETENIDENSMDKVLEEADKEDYEEEANISEEEEEEEDDAEDDDLIENDVDMTDNKKPKSKFVDEEAEETEDEGENDDECADDEEDEEDNEDENEEPEIKLPELPPDDHTQSQFPSNLENLCSGEFMTQLSTLPPLGKEVSTHDSNFSQDLFSQRSEESKEFFGKDDDDDEEEEVVNSTMTKKSARPLVISDDEDAEVNEDESKEDDIDEAESKVDDEEDCGDEENEIEDDEAVDNVNSADEEDSNMEIIKNLSPGKKLEYNSEEELVEVTNFLDKEAELSGSEWGSEDEDEKGLSDFEADEADMEKIDQRKLKSELDQMYMKDLLMEDKQQVRLLQEILLEDGDLHSDGPKRQRLYRWSSQGNENFDGAAAANSDDEVEEEVEEELSWRQARSEREQFISLHQTEVEEKDVAEVSVKVTKEITTKRVQVVTPNPPKSDATSPDFKLQSYFSARRGSFLGRGAVLARLAAAAANPEGDGRSRTGKHMVFAALSPPKVPEDEIQPEVKKRKAVQEVKQVTKKLKFDPVKSRKNNISILEKLREF